MSPGERRRQLTVTGVAQVMTNPLYRTETHARARSGCENAEDELLEVSVVIAGLLNLGKLFQAGIDGCPLGTVVLEQRDNHFGRDSTMECCDLSPFLGSHKKALKDK